MQQYYNGFIQVTHKLLGLYGFWVTFLYSVFEHKPNLKMYEQFVGAVFSGMIDFRENNQNLHS